MKNSVLFIGIVLVTLTNVCNASNLVRMKSNSLAEKTSSTTKRTLEINNYNLNLVAYEVIDSVNTNKIEKTADQLIAEDNAITENNISNDTQVLDYNLINRNSIVAEVIESPSLAKTQKTADQLIAEDNVITENNISNETQALDFEIINRNSNLVTDISMN